MGVITHDAMNTTRTILPALALGVAALQVGAQEKQDETRAKRPAQARAWTLNTTGDEDRPRLGISTGPGGKRDTLGLLVTDVTRGGPAEKAGIEEGDRLQSVNGVNLRVASADLEDDAMAGVGTRRLVRELGKLKAGDEADLRVYRDGQVRSVKVKTVTAEELRPERVTVSTMRRETEERAALGIGLGGSGSRRDTLGILISSVTDDGPADKARVEEGDRIAAINGVDLRVPGADAGDWAVSSSRMRRLTREMQKVKAGDEVELRLVRGGQGRTVRVKTVAARDLPGGGRSFFIGGDGGEGFSFGFDGLGGQMRLMPPMPPMGDMNGMLYLDRDDAGGVRMQLSPERRAEIEGRIGQAMQKLRDTEIRVQPRIQLRQEPSRIRIIRRGTTAM